MLNLMDAGAQQNLAPFFHETEKMGANYFEPYNPSPLVLDYQRMMHKNMEEELEYRRPQEAGWREGYRLINQLATPIDDERLSNVLIPIVKIIIMSRLASMTKGEMEVTYVPGFDDDEKIELWQDARRYVNNKRNWNYEMQQAYLTLSIFGNAPLFDGYRAAYQTAHVPDGAGGYRQLVAPDPRQSGVFTQSIMPWNFMVSGGGRDFHDAPHYTYTRYMDYDSWVMEFARVPKASGKPLYMNTRCVQPGQAHGLFQDDKTKQWGVRTQKLEHRKVCVNYHWIPPMNIHMIESNGALNWIGPNPYKHGRSPFSMLRLHPQMDPKGGRLSVWWQGDPMLLSGLDTMYQNVGNMFVDGFYFSQSSVIGVPYGLNLDVEDETFYGGTVIKGAEQMVVNQLGKVDGQSYSFMWKMLNDLLVWSSGVPFNQLVPEGQITAYELSKRLEKANERQVAIFKQNETYGLKDSEEKKLSNIFQFLPKEEFYAISDSAAVDQMIDEGKILKNDVVWEDGIPVMVRRFPMIETKGRIIQEKFVNGMPVPENAKVIERGVSGRLPARPEYLHPTEWLQNNGIPDVYVNSATIFGEVESRETENTVAAANFAMLQNERAKKLQKPEPFDEDEIHEDMLKTFKKNPRKWLKKVTSAGKRLGSVDVEEELRQMKQIRDERDNAPEPMMPQQEVPPAAQMQIPTGDMTGQSLPI